ncbi:MAG: sigma-70 family RNA polymerase sigma factor [Pseudomonadota bacterium]
MDMSEINDQPISWDDLEGLLSEAKAMARGLLAHELSNSLRSTELVLTALGRLRRSDQDWAEVEWENRKYFFGALYKAMRRALTDHARRRKAEKRAPEVRLEPEQFAKALNDADIQASVEQQPALIEQLMLSLEELRHREPDWVTMIEHRYFGGLTLEETGRMMGVNARTIQRWWLQARLVLFDAVREGMER